MTVTFHNPVTLNKPHKLETYNGIRDLNEHVKHVDTMLGYQ